MIKSSTRTLLSSLVVATAVLSAVPVTTAQARDFRDSPIYKTHQGYLLRLQESRRTKYQCNWNNGICPNPEPPRIYPTTEPGSFWRLVDVCEYLEGVSCYIDTYEVDDNS